MALDPGVVEFLNYRASLNLPDVKAFHTEIRKAGHADKDISGPIDASVIIEHRFITTPTVPAGNLTRNLARILERGSCDGTF